jgi:lipid A 3-O-deacylase
MKYFVTLVYAVLALNCGAQSAALPVGERSYWDLETGLLAKVGGDTPHDYLLVPTSLSWRSGEVFGWDLANGSRVLVRNRLTFIAQYFAEGPETFYGGLSGSPSLEWWSADGRFSLYAGAGGGFGWLDHQPDVVGAMGQSFTLNWFGKAGLSLEVAQGLELRLGVLFQHMSNGGMTEVNPGLDSLGGTVGLSWRF